MNPSATHPVFEGNSYYLTPERGSFKYAAHCTIHEPGGETVLIGREEMGWFKRLIRFIGFPRLTSFDLRFFTPEGEYIMRVHRNIRPRRPKVEIFDATEHLVGSFREKLFSGVRTYQVRDRFDVTVFTMACDEYLPNDFQVMAKEDAVARVVWRWPAADKGLFSNAHDAAVDIHGDFVPPDSPARPLLLAAAVVLHLEHKR